MSRLCFSLRCPATNTSPPVNNDFHQKREIFDLFDGLSVKEYDDIVPAANEPAATTNGATNGAAPAN